MSLVAVINQFATGTYTVTRAGAGTYMSGRYVAATTNTFPITASVQPMSGRDLQVLPEAFHSDDVKKLYTGTELRTRTPTQAPDIVAIGAENYEVINVKKWQAHGETHYKVLVSLITEQPDLEWTMQSAQEQSFQYTIPSTGDTFTITLPVEATDDTYVLSLQIASRPSATSPMAKLEYSSRTTTSFQLDCGYPLDTGTVIDVIVRDRA